MIYYINVNGKKGRKFQIRYIKKHPYFQCDKCKDTFSKGKTFVREQDRTVYALNKFQERIVVTSIKTTLNSKKDTLPCNKLLHQLQKCEGTIRFAGWKIWVDDVTNYKTTNFGGGFVVSEGTKVVETCFVDMRDKIDHKVRQLRQKYEEM